MLHSMIRRVSTTERSLTTSAAPRPRILLTSVFGPYARDDEYGSRRVNPMELHHNQVTRVQGPFSLRMFHRSWGLMMIQSNLESPCTLLDFPDQDRFIREIREHRYDLIGISAIIPNVHKVKRMCDLIRRYRPEATIVVGGHVCNAPDIEHRIDADHIVRGEGIRWFREFLGEDADAPIRHPEILSAFGLRTMGHVVREGPDDTAATIVPSVGCPMGCNFCCTSAMFGGKGKHITFYSTGEELFDLMSKLEQSMGISSFFIMDENFLLYQKRVRRLLELMTLHGKAWSLSLFSSANAIRSYSIDELVRLGVSWVWMGLEGEDSSYSKLDGVDTLELVKSLRANGIKVLGSTIIGLPEHTPENVDRVIERAVRHHTDFHQFMLYMPMPGTPLYAEMEGRGVLKDETECDLADIHGQEKFNYRHPHIPDGEEGEFLLRAFQRDYEVNGASLTRIVETMLTCWRRHRHHPDERVRRRVVRESLALSTMYAGVLGGARHYFRRDPAMREKLGRLHREMVSAFGRRAWWWSRVAGRLFAWSARREEKRLARGFSWEPRSFYEVNQAALDHSGSRGDGAELCRQVSVRPAPSPEPSATRGYAVSPSASAG